MRVVTLVPRRGDGGHRDRLWAFVADRWRTQHPDWPIFEAPGPDGLFNRSAAINAAAAQAGDWDVAVVLDADVIPDPDGAAAAVDAAHHSGRLALSHTSRVDINQNGTNRVLSGYRGNWQGRQMVETTWSDSVSCCVAVPRRLWDRVGGFDPFFVGWGYEDSAFHAACERIAGPTVVCDTTLFHLWHDRRSPSTHNTQARLANRARLTRYEQADDAELEDLLTAARAEQARLDSGAPPLPVAEAVPAADGLIPRVFHRTLPADTPPLLERYWEDRQALHPGWEFRTYREPVDPALFPLTSPVWPLCETGAQKADLIRLEALLHWGGVYVDSDCRPVGSHEPLRCCPAYAAWEDETTIPNAVLGSVPGHPAIEEVLNRAVAGVRRGEVTRATGVALTTEVFAGRDDMVILPPGSFYSHHYLQLAAAGENVGPWTIEEHMWHGSWLTPEQHAANRRNQRTVRRQR